MKPSEAFLSWRSICQTIRTRQRKRAIASEAAKRRRTQMREQVLFSDGIANL